MTPGFIDPHVHYDGQIMWDSSCTPSCHYGVTTVIGGNCGLGIAPLGAANADYLLEILPDVVGLDPGNAPITATRIVKAGPNPFVSTTTIGVELAGAGKVSAGIL